MREVGAHHSELRDLEADVRQIVRFLESGNELLATAGDYAPPIDVAETERGLDVQVDLPGVPADALHVRLARGTLIVAGEKMPASCEDRGAAFLLAERGFGRFVRAVRLSGAWDLGAAEARLSCGVLYIHLPRLAERRGREIRIPVRVD
jgi:HSP20 family protein